MAKKKVKVKIEDIGTFDVTSGSLIVSDPCYKRGTWCAGKLDNVRNGSWTASNRMLYSSKKSKKKEGTIGTLFVTYNYSEAEANLLLINDELQYKDSGINVGVDSGQVGMFDDSIYPLADVGEYTDPNSFYYKACQQGIIDGKGVVSSTAYGDGSYPCWVGTDSSGQIVTVHVEFVSDDDVDDLFGGMFNL